MVTVAVTSAAVMVAKFESENVRPVTFTDVGFSAHFFTLNFRLTVPPLNASPDTKPKFPPAPEFIPPGRPSYSAFSYSRRSASKLPFTTPLKPFRSASLENVTGIVISSPTFAVTSLALTFTVEASAACTSAALPGSTSAAAIATALSSRSHCFFTFILISPFSFLSIWIIAVSRVIHHL